MIVRIGANVDDLTKGMDKATKEVAKASTKIAELGKSMTLYLTAPVALAAYEFSKMAAEADSLGDRLERVFGDKAQAMTDFIKDLRQTVPESTIALTKMAIELQNLSLNMGMSRDKAFAMSEGIIKMAGDAAAFAHIPMEEALQGFERGLAGKTRGLVQFGMVINLANIKQEAFRLGLMNTGKTLTPLGIAIASYSLMQQQASRFTGEAGRIAGEEVTQFAQLKANFVDMAVKLGTLVLPTVIALVNALNTLMQWISDINPEVLKFTLLLLGMAATIGPILGMVAGLGKIVVAIRAITAAVTAAGTVMEFFALLTAPEIVAGIALIAAAITGITMAIHHFTKAKADVAKSVAGPVTNPMGTAGVGGGATSYDATQQGTGFDLLERQAKAITAEFQYAQARGQSLLTFYDQAAKAQEQLTQYAKNGADSVKLKAVQAMRALQPLLDEKTFQKMGLGKTAGGQAFGLPAMDVVTRLAEKGGELSSAFELAVKQGGDLAPVFTEAYRQAGLLDDIIAAQPDKLSAVAIAAGKAYEALRPLMSAGNMMGFSGSDTSGGSGPSMGKKYNAAGAAAMQAGKDTTSYYEGLRLREEMAKLTPAFSAVREGALAVAESFKLFQQSTAQRWEELKAWLQHFKDAMKDVTATLKTGLQAALLNVIDTLQGMVQGLAQNISNKIAHGSGAANIGGQLGAAAGAGIGYAMGGPVGAAIGSALGNIGGTIVGKTLGKIGGAISGLFGHHHKAAASLDALAAAANKTTAALSNAPSGFKIALARFNATDVGGGPVGSGSPGTTNFHGDIYIDARTKSVKQLLDELGLAQKQLNKRGGAGSLSVALAGA